MLLDTVSAQGRDKSGGLESLPWLPPPLPRVALEPTLLGSPVCLKVLIPVPYYYWTFVCLCVCTYTCVFQTFPDNLG